MRCPCGLGPPLADCCGRYLAGRAHATTAERLMRSRYTAFSLGDMDHLMATWHSSTRPIGLRDDPTTRCTGLEVLDTSGGSLFDTTGTVHFRAHFIVGGADDVLEENSRFVREGGRWWYVEPL